MKLIYASRKNLLDGDFVFFETRHCAHVCEKWKTGPVAPQTTTTRPTPANVQVDPNHAQAIVANLPKWP